MADDSRLANYGDAGESDCIYGEKLGVKCMVDLNPVCPVAVENGFAGKSGV